MITDAQKNMPNGLHRVLPWLEKGSRRQAEFILRGRKDRMTTTLDTVGIAKLECRVIANRSCAWKGCIV